MEYTRAELTPRRITGSTVTVIQSGRSFLGNITLNSSLGAIQIYDNIVGGVAGSAIAVIGSAATVLAYNYNFVMATGITIATNNADYTITSANN